MLDFIKKIPIKINDNEMENIKSSNTIAIFNWDNVYTTILWFIYLKETLNINEVHIYFNLDDIKNSKILTINLAEKCTILNEYIDDIINIKDNLFYILPLIQNIIHRYNILTLFALYKWWIDYSNNVIKNLVKFLVADIEDNWITLESVSNLIHLLSERKSLDTYGFYNKIFNILDVCETYLWQEFIFNIISNKFYWNETIIPELYNSIKSEFIRIQNSNDYTGDYNENMRNALSKYFYYIKSEITQIWKPLNKYEVIYNYYDWNSFKTYVLNKKEEWDILCLNWEKNTNVKILNYEDKRFTIFELHRVYKENAPFWPGNLKPLFKFKWKFTPYNIEKQKFYQTKTSKNWLKYNQYRFITTKWDNIVINDFDKKNTMDFTKINNVILDIIYPTELNSKNKLSFILK